MIKFSGLVSDHEKLSGLKRVEGHSSTRKLLNTSRYEKDLAYNLNNFWQYVGKYSTVSRHVVPPIKDDRVIGPPPPRSIQYSGRDLFLVFQTINCEISFTF